MDTEKLLEGLHPLEVRLLRAMSEEGTAGEGALMKDAGLPEDRFRRAVEWLLTKGVLEVVDRRVRRRLRLTQLGESVAAEGPPELRLFRFARDAGPCRVPELLEKAPLGDEEARTAFGKLRKEGALVIESGVVRVSPHADLSRYERIKKLAEWVGAAGGVDPDSLSPEDRALAEGLVHKRHPAKGVFRVEEKQIRTFRLTELGHRVRRLAAEKGLTGEEVSRLTPEMLRDGSWRGKVFRKYSFDLAPPRPVVARRHPYREFLDYLKYKLVALGFEEMRGPLVECEFWNMDALFMPQFHAARDIHDAYFVARPTHASWLDPELVRRVAAVHESGGDTGSRGWGYSFDKKKTRRLVLRTQGTALSARTCASKPKIPGKYFAFARCFRPDTVDATHACDFFQVEGIVLGEQMNFCTLLGLLELFAKEVARAEAVKFVPAYFPFTEPSVEAHMKHPALGWIELGGAGIFRPEVTRPLGVEVPVLAWGLGIDRMAMVALKINDIRELFSTDLAAIRRRRLEMEFA